MVLRRRTTESPDRRRTRRWAGSGLAAVAVTVGSMVLAAPALAATSGSTSGGSVDANGIAAGVDPAIVDVNTTLAQGGAAGTGMVISSSGEVLTNNHVIDGATSVSVTVASGKSYPAKVVGYDAADDVAVLQIEGAPKLPTVTVSSTKPSVGDPVVALGNALGRGGTPATAAGSVTATNQTITATDDNGANPETLNELIQINANIQPGDSGGPLVNANGQVIGMNSAGSSQAATTSPGSADGPGSGYFGGGSFGGGSFGPGSDFGGGSAFGGGTFGGGSFGGGTDPNSGGGSASGGGTVGYAIPIEKALAIAHQIESGKSSGNVTVGTRAILGVEVQGTSTQGGVGAQGGIGGQSTSGVPISGVESGSPAASAGLTGGDTIVSIDGHSVATSADITSALAGHHPGDHVNVRWIDNAGNQQQASFALVAGPPA